MSQTSLTLANKNAVVTGVLRGISAAIACEFAKRGANVAITYTSLKTGELVDEMISKIASLENGSRAIKIQADARVLTTPQEIVSETIRAFEDGIDILVNNAGVAAASPISEITVDHIAEDYDVNVRGVILTTQAVVPHLRSPGRINNLTSIVARNGQVNSSLYSLTKAAVEALTRCWAIELGPAGHTVNNVAPGLTATDLNGHCSALPTQAQELIKAVTPLGHRFGEPEDIALAVMMLAEPASRWITAQTINASGGSSI